jgi:hypothetical protein
MEQAVLHLSVGRQIVLRSNTSLTLVILLARVAKTHIRPVFCVCFLCVFSGLAHTCTAQYSTGLFFGSLDHDVCNVGSHIDFPQLELMMPSMSHRYTKVLAT